MCKTMSLGMKKSAHRKEVFSLREGKDGKRKLKTVQQPFPAVLPYKCLSQTGTRDVVDKLYKLYKPYGENNDDRWEIGLKRANGVGLQ